MFFLAATKQFRYPHLSAFESSDQDVGPFGMCVLSYYITAVILKLLATWQVDESVWRFSQHI